MFIIVEVAFISVWRTGASFSFCEIFFDFFHPPTTTTLQKYMTEAHSRGYRHITILCLGKDSFGVDL